MPRLTASLVTACFILWILPLGVFIKPAQEKIACDGQRAICLCSHAQSKHKSNPIEANGLKNTSEANKEANASGGAGHYYLATLFPIKNILKNFTAQDLDVLAYRNPCLISIEHVPKV